MASNAHPPDRTGRPGWKFHAAFLLVAYWLFRGLRASDPELWAEFVTAFRNATDEAQFIVSLTIALGFLVVYLVARLLFAAAWRAIAALSRGVLGAAGLPVRDPPAPAKSRAEIEAETDAAIAEYKNRAG